MCPPPPAKTNKQNFFSFLSFFKTQFVTKGDTELISRWHFSSVQMIADQLQYNHETYFNGSMCTGQFLCAWLSFFPLHTAEDTTIALSIA